MKKSTKVTIEDLSIRAISAIANSENFVQDVADNVGHMVDNVGHTEWFRVQVMFWLINDYQKYAHLRQELEQDWEQLF
ncbi:hypothetical protein FD723_40275 (plasmid) [Nostoc sp. C052]|uniref:hypothetical protein n=1 Tax=Nostoc sp. C052 TaxID=2576902 RepID=UPI0015C38CEA|nr:hypothetical protein [Nostoc sp. C052]QLE46451.1 hypothetical protein FD723_40275 [Nostoc sp. C052]